MQIHDKLKAIRQFKGWSQEEMAKKLHYTPKGYAKIERGEVDINITKLARFAKVLEVDLQKLLELNEGNVLNFVESIHANIGIGQCNIVLTEAQCVHELEKTRLLLQERDKEVSYLKEENAQLKEIIKLMKKDHSE